MKAKGTREKILAAAQRLIVKGGSVRLTTKLIAREAGCAEGTLFAHFRTKEDLCLAVVLENAPVFRAALSTQRAGERTVGRNLEDIARASLSFFEQLIPLAVAVMADGELLKRHRQEMKEKKRGPEDVFALLNSYIGQEQQLNRVNQQVAAPAAAALVLGPCFHRVFIRQAMGKQVAGPDDREFVASLVKTVMAGLSPSDG